MTKIFMFYVGGSCGNSNTELHDVRFSIGGSVEDCLDDLRAQWWGTPVSLHLDCWGAVEQADGHDIALVPAPAAAQEGRLYFVNLGGYRAGEFSELHRNLLIVAADAAEAKARALTLVTDWFQPHRDQLFEVEHMLDLTQSVAAHGLAVQLTPASTEKPFSFDCGYWPIGKDEATQNPSRFLAASSLPTR